MKNVGSLNIVELGSGRFIINHGYFGKRAAVFIEPAPEPGEIGDAPPKDALANDTIADGSTVILLSNIASADVLGEELTQAIKLIGTR